jgi:Ca2+-binding RTX toxin-like protein
MPAVTVNGANGQFVVLNYDTAAYAALATSLLGANTGATLLTGTGAALQTIAVGQDVVGIGALDDSTGGGLGTINVYDGNTDAGQLILVGSGTNMLFGAPSGSGTIIAGSGSDTLSVGTGAWTIGAGPGDQVFLGSGADTVITDGATTVVAGLGDETVFGSDAGGAMIYGGSGTLTYVGGSGASTITAGSGTVLGFGGSGETTYFLGSGDAILTGGNDSVVGSTGALQWFGDDSVASSINFSGAADNNLFVAGGGNDTLNASGSTGANVFYAGAGDDTITAGSGNDILFGGAGDSTLTGGAGYNVFAFADQAGGSTSTDTITDWGSSDVLELVGVGIQSQDLSSGSLSVSLTDGTTINFTGVTSDLNPDQVFSFGGNA